MVTAGTIIRMSKNPPQPEQGIRSSSRQVSHRNAGMLTMIGMDMRINAVATVLGSCQVPCLWAM